MTSVIVWFISDYRTFPLLMKIYALLILFILMVSSCVGTFNLLFGPIDLAVGWFCSALIAILSYALIRSFLGVRRRLGLDS